VSRAARLRDSLDRLHRVADTLASPGVAKALARCRPFSIASFRIVAAVAEAGVEPDIVLDVGANRGQFAAAALHRWPGCRVVSFEPVEAVAAQLRAVRSGGRLTVHQVALGRRSGVLPIHVHRYSPSTSALAALDATDEASIVEVRLCTLDEVLADVDLAGRRVLLKLDVQGFEVEVLAGATEVLGAVDRIVVEQAFVPAYDGQPLFEEVHVVLQGLGFRLDRLVDARRAGGQVVEVDCLYARSTASPSPT